MVKYIIFDIDGTLNQTHRYAVEAYQKALLKRNRVVDKQDIIACIGMSPKQIIEALFGSLTEEEIKKWRQDIKEFEFDLMKDRAAAFDGMQETLQTLKQKGYLLAVCSNAFPNHIEHVLKSIGLREYFDEIASLEMGKDKGEVLGNLLEKLAPVKACMVGDRKFDLQAAKQNQVPIIGCAYGYAPEEVKSATVVVNKPIEIIEAVKLIFE